MTVGGRVDDNSHYGTHASPKLSAGGFAIPFTRGTLSSLKVFTNMGRGIKNPVFGELSVPPSPTGIPTSSPSALERWMAASS